MLIKLWERLHGYDKWTPVDAIVQSSDLAEVDFGPRPGRNEKPTLTEWESSCTIMWVDSDGKRHTARFEVREGSPLFQLYGGQKVGIRYDPSAPDRFYLPGVLKSKVFSTIKWLILTVIFALIALFILWIH